MLVQLRIGGQQARLTDETVPPRFGTIGQETTGAGGFAKALRTVQPVLELGELTGRRGAPGAWLVDFTNPVGIITQALLDAGHRAVGLCNVAIGLQRRLAARFGVEPEDVQLGHVGLNHLTWVRHVWVDGEDRLPALLDDAAEDMADEAGGMPVELVRVLKAVPSSYLRYYYCFNDVLREQQAGEQTRANEVMDIENQLLELYKDPTLDTKPACWRTGAAPSTARQPRSSWRHCTMDAATSRWSTRETTARSRPARRRGGRSAGTHRPGRTAPAARRRADPRDARSRPARQGLRAAGG